MQLTTTGITYYNDFQAAPQEVPPSQDHNSFWHLAVSPHPVKLSSCGGGNGKFMVFVDLKDLDVTWEKVKELTIDGYLSYKSQASTLRSPHSMPSDFSKKVIRVFTPDYYDLDEIARVAWMLYATRIFKGGVLNYSVEGSRKSLYSIGIKSFEINDSREKLADFLKMKYYK